jgi:hypothetical protein
MTKTATELTLQRLKNESADKNVSPVIPREGIMGIDAAGNYRNILVNSDGELVTRIAGPAQMVIVAEDINNPGTYVAVQGQYNSNGNFELLTAGSGAATADGNFDDMAGNDLEFMDGTSMEFMG